MTLFTGLNVSLLYERFRCCVVAKSCSAMMKNENISNFKMTYVGCVHITTYSGLLNSNMALVQVSNVSLK